MHNSGDCVVGGLGWCHMRIAKDKAARVAVVRNLAIASAKQGDVISALRLADEMHNFPHRRSTLSAIALPQ
jgi:hypothetical protein